MPNDSSLPSNTVRSVRLLSNGSYTVLLTDAGSGFSRWRDLAVTRWREDPTADAWGSYILLRDLDSGVGWSATAQPCADPDAQFVTTFLDGRAEFVRRHDGLSSTLEIAVARGCDAELRRITLVNHGDAAREIALTSYAELVLGSAAADATHPAFSKLFVQTEALQESGILLATRRPRTPGEPAPWAAHFALGDMPLQAFEFETDRARFLGRGRMLRNAAAMRDQERLSNTAGYVLDPVFSVRQRVRIEPGASVAVTFCTLIADSRDAALALGDSLRASGACDRVLAGAATQVSTQRAQPGIAAGQEICDRLLAPLLYADAAWRAAPDVLARGSGGAPVLWACGISGDRPIVLMCIASAAGLDQVRTLLDAQRLWRSQWLGVDVVLLNTASATEADALQATLIALVQAQQALFQADAAHANAGVFVLRDDAISAGLRDGLMTAARVLLDAAADGSGPLDRASMHGGTVAEMAAARQPVRSDVVPDPDPSAAQSSATLQFDNGIGGFDVAAREYAISLADGRCTPLPWINVIANPLFGCIVSAEGGGYTWSLNSQQNALTPWPNDPVSDTPHEVLYLRDQDSGELWSATALPIRVVGATYDARHGKGYSRFSSSVHAIETELLQFVPVSDSIKLSRLRIRNRSGRARRLSITGYVEWALGANGTVPAPFVVTSIDAATGALFARNAWRTDFGGRVAFIDLGGAQQCCSGDRAGFLGRHGAVDRPLALGRPTPLSNRVGAGLDPCGALQTRIELAADAQVEILFLHGDADSAAQAQALIEQYRTADLDAVLQEVRANWNDALDTVQVRTPDRALDILLNDWLPYQTLACRVWARTAYYQASGAYGFRDQLQDVMALCLARPDVAREHLLRAAGRQFVEGDVQHWWLPPSGQGIRTRITDDRVWLAYTAAHYLEVTADSAVLDEVLPFLAGATIKDGDVDAFFQPGVSPQQVSLYQHCALALDASLSLGVHGLPLMGTGDWNDGMNRVGEKGRGESVWLAWFLLATIDAFAPTAETRGDRERAGRWRAFAATLRVALDQTAWDGRWYRRGYYDDGTPLGSATSDECRIDAIAQSWSVIAGATDRARATQAMQAVDEQLIRRDDRIALLFTPPFDRTTLDPGYIKGYPPGIRENGGQYTHGTIWSIFAFAMLGQGDKAGELFSILNPIHHASTPETVACYQVEPYVSCADVYSVAPHVGRGGWTWYSGSAGWLYRAGLEAILGFRVRGDSLLLDPCIPAAWPACEIVYRHRGPHNTRTRYRIAIENPRNVCRGVVEATCDGTILAIDPGTRAARIALLDDGGTHRVRIVLG